MNNKFNSPVFGSIRHADDDESIEIARLVETCPSDVFGALNVALNTRGFQLSIARLEEGAG